MKLKTSHFTKEISSNQAKSMESFMENQGLLHIGEKILKYLDLNTRINCRLVRKSWNAREASRTKLDLNNLLKSLKESVNPASGYFEMLEKDKICTVWTHFAMAMSSKLNNHISNIVLKKHLMFQSKIGFSSLPLEHFVLKRDLKMVGLTLKQKLYHCKTKRPTEFSFYLVFADRDFDGALQKAVENGCTDIVKVFKRYMTKEHHREYVFEPSEYGELDTLKILCPNPKDTLPVDCFGNNSIHIAVRNDNIEIVKYFIENIKGLEAQNNSGHTPLYYAVIDCNHPIIDDIVKAVSECHILKPISEGMNVIHIAAEKGDFDVVYQLCEELNNPIRPDDKGNTPIHYAASNGHLEILTFLTSKSTSSMIPNKNGETPFQLAWLNHHDKAAKFLAEYENSQSEGTER